MQILAEPFTDYDTYYAWAEHTPDGEYYEVVDGQPVVSPTPTLLHQRCLVDLAVMLHAARPSEFEVLFGPFDWLLWESPSLQVRQPDVFITRRIEDLTSHALVEPPLLAVEILSPWSFERDTVTKRREYAQAGLDHYWVVDPETPRVAIYQRQGDQLALMQQVTGRKRVALTEPFELSFAPADLLA